MNIVWSDTARADLRCIYAYIARDSKFYAKRTLDGIELSVAVWAGLQRLGPVFRNGAIRIIGKSTAETTA